MDVKTKKSQHSNDRYTVHVGDHYVGWVIRRKRNEWAGYVTEEFGPGMVQLVTVDSLLGDAADSVAIAAKMERPFTI